MDHGQKLWSLHCIDIHTFAWRDPGEKTSTPKAILRKNTEIIHACINRLRTIGKKHAHTFATCGRPRKICSCRSISILISYSTMSRSSKIWQALLLFIYPRCPSCQGKLAVDWFYDKIFCLIRKGKTFPCRDECSRVQLLNEQLASIIIRNRTNLYF
jgi:hypothetical protein